MFTIEYTHKISMAHRLYPYTGKCSKLHGHNYSITFVVACDKLDNGMVLDFNVIKRTLGLWLDENWDHKLMLAEKDPLCVALSPWNCGVVSVPYIPTAEKMAVHLLLLNVLSDYDRGVRVIEVRVEETDKCYAVVCNDVVAQEKKEAKCRG